MKASLGALEAAGWLDGLFAEYPELNTLGEVLGEIGLTLALAYDCEVRQLEIDPHNIGESVLHFRVGDDDKTHRMEANQFRHQLVALLETRRFPEVPTAAPTSLPTDDQLQAYIGHEFVLLAPLFGIRLINLVFGESPIVEFQSEDRGLESSSLAALRQMLTDRVRIEVARAESGSAFRVDINVLSDVEKAAARQDWAYVVGQIGSWPGPLSRLLESGQGGEMTNDIRSKIAKGLALLAQAYGHVGREDWVSEIERLAIQWSRGLPIAAYLYGQMADRALENERYGEAIGLFRRALALGLEPKRAYPHLARCYVERRRWIAAAACIDLALAHGAKKSTLSKYKQLCAERLDPHWTRLRRLVPLQVSTHKD